MIVAELLLTKMVTEDMPPFTFVEREAFHKLMAFVKIEYKPPSWSNNGYKSEKMLVDIRAVTTDPGKALTTELYVTITWVLKTSVLQMCSTD